MANLDTVGGNKLQSISVRPTASGMAARERFNRVSTEPTKEMTLRILGLLMMATAILLWFFVSAQPDPDDILPHNSLGSFLLLVGLGVFIYGTKGFRRQMSLDVASGTLSLTKININRQVRLVHKVKLREIKSVFLRRHGFTDGQSTLLVRIAGNPVPVIGLTGDSDEIASLHGQLCDAIKSAKTVTPKTPFRFRRRRAPKRKLFSAGPL